MTFHNFLQGHWSAPICRSLQIWLFLQETLPCPIDGMIPLNIAELVFSINRKKNVLVGGLKHEWILCSISLIWDVIRNPLTNESNIFQDGHIAPATRVVQHSDQYSKNHSNLGNFHIKSLPLAIGQQNLTISTLII
jgi:hypothetical protein